MNKFDYESWKKKLERDASGTCLNNKNIYSFQVGKNSCE